MNAQFIKKNGRKAFAVLPYRKFLRMQEKLEDYADLIALDKAKSDPCNRKHHPLTDYMRQRGIIA